MVAALVMGLLPLATTVDSAAAAATAQDWPTFLHDAGRTSATTDPNLTVANANLLQPKWTYTTAAPVVAGVTVVGTTAYVGSWDGYEYALNTNNGSLVWKTSLGVTTNANCDPATLGITSTATVANGVLYVGGGGPYWYALDPGTGGILWSVFTGDTSATGGHYNYSSPLIVNGKAYIGIASNCDNPVVQGQLLEVDLTTHQVVATYNVVPNGQLGGGIWASPSYDPATNTVFVATGNLNDYRQTQSQAIVALDAGTLTPKSWWQLPFAASVTDSDWSTTPELTTDTAGDQLLTVANKNGFVYTFNRNNLAAGPLWQRQIAIGGDCLICGQGSVSSGAFANGVIYWAGGNAFGNGHGSGGSVNAIDAATGTVLWTRQTDKPVVGSVALVNGMIGEVEGSTFEVVNASTGALLYSYVLPQGSYSPVTVANSQFYLGAFDGKVYAFGLGAAPKAPPADANCPSGFTCQDIHNPAKGSEQTSAGALTVTAAGTGIKGTGDQFRLISAPVSGDSQSSVRLTAQTAQPAQNQQAGLIVRQDVSVGSPFYAVLSYPNDVPPDVQVSYRARYSKNPTVLAKVPVTMPVSMMIQRRGNAFSAGLSTDGVSYQIVPGSTATLDLPTTTLQGLAVDSGASSNYGTATFTTLAVGGAPTTTLNPPPPAHPCPATWTCTDLGNPSPIGDTTGSGGSLTLAGAGSGFGAISDSAHFVYQPVSGNTAISALVTTQTGAPAKAQDGLMMRAGTAPTAPMYSVYLNPGGSATIQWRAYDGIKYSHNIPLSTVTSPAWLQVVRYQDPNVAWPNTFFSAATSTDGTTWAPVLGSSVAIDMGTGSYLAGLVATAGATGVTTPAAFGSVAVAAPTSPPAGICPSGWSCADVGTGVPAGNQLVQNGTWTLQGSGDIWSVYDEFRFISQSFPPSPSTTGDGTVSARVLSQSGGGGWTRSGVMLRSGTDPQAPYYAVFATPANGVVVQWRNAPGGLTSQVTSTGATTPLWVEASRYTDTTHNVVYYSAYSSTDGVNYTYVPNSEVALNLPGPLVGGIATDANSSSNLATATFDNVGIQSAEQPPPYLCPSSWTCADIGGALPPGQDQLDTSGTWHETGGGSDIWGTSDAFHFVSQSLAADGVVSAQVTAQQNTNAWAKAGPMMRATSDPASPYYAVLVTPTNGIAVQWRTTQGGSTSQRLVAGSAPAYLRVGRYTVSSGSNPGTYYTAYTSTDGTTWTAIAGSTVAINMTGPVLAGFAITSHNQGTADAVTLNSVAVAAGEPVPPVLCPNEWQCADINGATPAGSQTLSGSTWTVQGGGGDIWGTADAFRYLWQNLAGDTTATAQITSQTNTSAWAKAGLMMRLSTDPGSPYYAVFATPGNGIAVQWRSTQGATTSQVLTAGAVPLYVGIVRTGTTFGAETSADGVTWTPVAGSTANVSALTGSILTGLAVTSHNTGALSTVTFTNVITGGT